MVLGRNFSRGRERLFKVEEEQGCGRGGQPKKEIGSGEILRWGILERLDFFVIYIGSFASAGGRGGEVQELRRREGRRSTGAGGGHCTVGKEIVTVVSRVENQWGGGDREEGDREGRAMQMGRAMWRGSMIHCGCTGPTMCVFNRREQLQASDTN
jgi:hypothetical protein